MFKKVVSLFVATCLIVSLSACGSEKEVINKEYLSNIETAVNNLNSIETPYIISTMFEAPDADMEYIECIFNGASYTEYSVDDDGYIGTVRYGSVDSISYALTDWCTSDGKYYMFQSDENDNDVIYSLPDSYSSKIDGRKTMYVEDMVSKFTSIQQIDSSSIDIGYGEEEFTTYKCILPADCVKSILGAPSYGIYESIQREEGVSVNVSNLCQYYLNDLDMNLTFSDAIVYVGIDSNNILKYMCLEVGGLGTRLYVTKVVVETNNPNLRETPDFSSAVPYSSTLSDLADFVASFPSYDEALSALSQDNGIN